MRFIVIAMIIAVLMACSANTSQKEEPKTSKGDEKAMEQEYITTDSGLQYMVIQEGEGTPAQPGDMVEVHYTGWLMDGTKFDSSVDRGQPFAFKLGIGQVIKGWDEGVAGMKPGEKRMLILKPELAYGKRGAGRVIPPNATLKFEVEFIRVK